jgi:hypothetical protein
MVLGLTGNDIEQISNTYILNTFTKASITISKAKLKQLGLALLKHLLSETIFNTKNIFCSLIKSFIIQLPKQLVQARTFYL